MMQNVGPVEGVWRAALGGLALATGLTRGNPWLLGLGTIGLATAIGGYCPASHLLGIDTAHGERSALPGGEQRRLASEPSSAAG